MGGGSNNDDEDDDDDATMTSTCTIEWAKSIVGRDCEVYWSNTTNDENDDGDADVNAAASSTESDDNSKKKNNNNDDNKEVEAMTKSTENECEKDTQQPMDVDQVGDPTTEENKDKEEEDSNEEEEDDDDDEEHEEDWYDATIIALVSEERKEGGKEGDGSSGSSYTFKVSFAGDEDEEIYEMELSPSVVRPSARAWMRRTKAILDVAAAAKEQCGGGDKINDDEDTNVKSWIENLPKDTRTLADAQTLDDIQCNFGIGDNGEVPLRNQSEKQQPLSASSPSLLPSNSRMEEIRNLTIITKSQIYLRTKLAPASSDQEGGGGEKEDRGNDNNNSNEEDDDDDEGPTENELNFMVDCLRQLETSCEWYLRCWRLHSSILFSAALPVDVEEEGLIITQDSILKDYLGAGRRTITELVTTDFSCSKKRKQRGRTQQQQSSSSPSQQSPGSIDQTTTTSTAIIDTPTRRTKRRRKNKGYAGYQNDGKDDDDDDRTNTVMDYENLEEEEFLSAEVIDKFVETLRASDTRWFCQYFGSMLRSLSTNVVTPFMKWRRKVEFYLGETDDNGGNNIMSEVEDASQDIMEVDEGQSDDGRTSQQYVTYEEIKSVLELTETDVVLKHLELSHFAPRIKQKLAGIESFAAELEKLFATILDDGDDILCDLKCLLDTSRSKDSAVVNIEPFGRSPSQLTRNTIENAIAHRCWYLDLKRAETARERVQFVEDVVSIYNELPPLPTLREDIDMSTKAAQVESRVKALSEKLASFAESVAKYDGMLENPNGHEELATADAVAAALNNLRQTPFVSLAEEMLAIRKDVFDWSLEATPTLEATKPAFSSILDIKKKADLILEGKSPTRSAILCDIKDNANINTRVRDFARSEMMSVAGELQEKIDSIYAVASAWKDRADSIVTNLRQFGNPIAGEHLPTSKLPVMVDLKRIKALEIEYESLQVKLDDLYDVLSKVHSESVEWSSRMTSNLLDDSIDFEGCFRLVQGVGRERPKGIIVDPNRQVVDLLDELLSWYTTVKSSTGAETLTPEAVNRLLFEGLEVLESFSQNRGREEAHPFTVNTTQAIPLVTAQVKSRAAMRVLSQGKLESSPYGRQILANMVDTDRDSREGHPLLILLHSLWLITVEDFNTRCVSNTTERGDLSLVEAKRLLNSRPLPSAMEPTDAQNSPFTRIRGDRIAKLKELISEANGKEERVRDALSRSKSLLRDSLNKPEEVHQLLVLLKDLQGEFKNLSCDGVGSLDLDQKMEHQLDHAIKLFGWLDKAYQYRVLRTREIDDDCDFAENEKVPWDVLVWLCDRIPQSASEGVDFDYVLLRVKELREAATAWQEEINKFTMLSLRGGKRRQTKPESNAEDPGSNVPEEDESNQIDLKKVAELSNNPILSKVTMPREGAIRQMLDDTNKFEVQLHELLGTDYVGVNSDNVYPEPGSLVGKDSSFLLYRLTESPLFESLKASITSISETASDVFAETPGKATFEWIRQAVSWIESLKDSVIRLSSPPPLSQEQKGRLIIPCSEARKLLSSGDEIFLNVPDDLRKTLSKYKIYISSNKDGKLTVKSKKGGAHHSPGVTVVCWCPLLFDSLRADSQRLESWQRSVTGVAAAFTSYMQQPPKSEEDFMLRFHSFQDEVRDLLLNLQDLVVYPSSSLIDSTQRLLTGIDARIQSSNNAEISRKYAMSKFESPAAVVSNRFLLLDSLLNRRSNDPQVEMPSLSGTSKEASFRNALKSLLEKALRKGLSTIGLSPESEEASSLCALKAWEIECKLFDLFQGELGESKISPEYRERARALKRSLEDTGNVAFCVRVLTGQIKTDALVRMSSEDLANPKTKEERAKAAVAAEQSSVLTGMANSTQAKQTAKSGSSESKKVSPAEEANVGSPIKVMSEGKTTKTEPKSTATSPSITSTASGSPGGRSPSFTLGELAKAGRSSRPPPPPPSLAASIRSTQSTAPESDPDIMVSNSSGGQHFLVTLGSRTFSARFYAENDADSSLIDGLLPEELIEKGRLRIEEFTKFLKTKVDGGRWAAAPLRLATFSDKHNREYRKFSKDYESRQRIAMVPLQREAKLFLVTPKFHRAARGLTMPDSNSTYAVVLTRK